MIRVVTGLLLGGVLLSTATAGLEYDVETRLIPGTWISHETAVTIRNQAERSVTLQFPDACVVLVRAYADATRSGDPVWDQGRTASCPAARLRVPVEAGGEERHAARFTSRGILGDSLPGGVYYLTAYLRPDGEEIELDAGELEIHP